MISKNVQEMIPKIQQYLSSQPITKAWLFGSCSRGEETEKSDVDLLVRYDRSDDFSLMTIHLPSAIVPVHQKRQWRFHSS